MNYTNEELRRLGKHAAEEAKEMYIRGNPSGRGCAPEADIPDKAHKEENNRPENKKSFSVMNFISSILSGGDMDGIIIIFLIYILIKDKADSEIILALLYILL